MKTLSHAEVAARHAATWDWCGPRIQRLVRAAFPSLSTQILDVGACWGKYRILLPEYPHMDACEIWLPYVLENDLLHRYRQVIQASICDYAQSAAWQPYDVVIMGDVLEHIAAGPAVEMLDKVLDTCKEVFVIVPYLYPQGEEHGNPFQAHVQDDLTPDVMAERYPRLALISTEMRDGQAFKGIYRRSL